jgi:hypothetical protein
MEFFFADDTTQNSVRDGMGKIIGFGGIFVHDTVLGDLEQEINDICKIYSIPHGEEIKWSPRKKSWIYKNLHGDLRTKCYLEILEASKNADCRAVVVAWDTGRTTLQGGDAFKKVLDYAFERISLHLSGLDNLGVIVADRPGGGHKEDEQFLADFLTRINEGTDYVVPEHVPINILTTPSHLQRHLQIADLVTAITCAMVAGQTKYAEPLFPTIKDILIKNQYGYIGGTGLKLFPDELLNLYYVVLGETHYIKAGMNAGFPLPFSDHPYASKKA